MNEELEKYMAKAKLPEIGKVVDSAMDVIKKFAIELLEKQGCHYIYAPDIASDSGTPERIVQ